MKITYKKDRVEIDGIFTSLSAIIKNCNDIKVKEDNLVLLAMHWAGRSGDVLEQRALPIKSAERVKEILLGKEVYFGEIWGKHSEVYGTMDEDTFKIVKDKKKVKDFITSFPDGSYYDHSFIWTFIENNEEGEMQDDVTQELLDELKELIKKYQL